jgi:hypothetical protein
MRILRSFFAGSWRRAVALLMVTWQSSTRFLRGERETLVLLYPLAFLVAEETVVPRHIPEFPALAELPQREITLGWLSMPAVWGSASIDGPS